MSYDLDSTTLMPMDDALKSANRTDSSFDILLCLKQAQATSSLTLNLPWIIEHVKIMKLDKLTRYVLERIFYQIYFSIKESFKLTTEMTFIIELFELIFGFY